MLRASRQPSYTRQAIHATQPVIRLSLRTESAGCPWQVRFVIAGTFLNSSRPLSGRILCPFTHLIEGKVLFLSSQVPHFPLPLARPCIDFDSPSLPVAMLLRDGFVRFLIPWVGFSLATVRRGRGWGFGPPGGIQGNYGVGRPGFAGPNRAVGPYPCFADRVYSLRVSKSTADSLSHSPSNHTCLLL
jgi:hypothetical protein